MPLPEYSPLRGTPATRELGRTMTPKGFYEGLLAAGWTFRTEVDPTDPTQMERVLFVTPPTTEALSDYHRHMIRAFRPALMALTDGQEWTVAHHLRWLADQPWAFANTSGDEQAWDGIVAFCYAQGVAHG